MRLYRCRYNVLQAAKAQVELLAPLYDQLGAIRFLMQPTVSVVASVRDLWVTPQRAGHPHRSEVAVFSFRRWPLLAPTAPLSDVERGLTPECAHVRFHVIRLNAALMGPLRFRPLVREGLA